MNQETLYLYQLLETTQSLNKKLSAFHKAGHITWEELTLVKSEIDFLTGRYQGSVLKHSRFMDVSNVLAYMNRAKQLMLSGEDRSATRICMYLGSILNKTKVFHQNLSYHLNNTPS